MNKSECFGIILASVLSIAGCQASKQVESREQYMNSTAPTCNSRDAATVDVAGAAKNVPVIDVSALMDPSSYASPQWVKAAEEVSSACEEWGFFQASGTQTAACCFMFRSTSSRNLSDAAIALSPKGSFPLVMRSNTFIVGGVARAQKPAEMLLVIFLKLISQISITTVQMMQQLHVPVLRLR